MKAAVRYAVAHCGADAFFLGCVLAEDGKPAEVGADLPDCDRREFANGHASRSADPTGDIHEDSANAARSALVAAMTQLLWDDIASGRVSGPGASARHEAIGNMSRRWNRAAA